MVILITQSHFILMQYAFSKKIISFNTMKKILFYLVIFSFHLVSCGQSSNNSSNGNDAIANSINADEFEQAIQQPNIQILDVRTAGEFAIGHIKNAMQANYNDESEFTERVKYLDKSKPVYIYCLSGARSNYAMNTLQQMGFTKLYHLVGGINAWRSHNKPLEGMNNEPQISVADYEVLTKKDSMVLVDFGAEWCPPCKKMEPIIQQLLKEKPDLKLLKMDGSSQQTVMQSMNVTALPVFIIYKNGKQVWRKDGEANLPPPLYLL